MRYKLIVRVLEEPLKEFYVSVALTPEQFAAQIQASLASARFFTFICEQKPNEVFFGKTEDIVYIHAIALPEPVQNSVKPESERPAAKARQEAKRA